MNELTEKLCGKDDKAAYEFVSLLNHKSSFVRTRGFIPICAQARWEENGRIAAFFKQMESLLNDLKPTVVRQCLKAMQEVVFYHPEMNAMIKKRLILST